jgi:hypothetical protein
LPDWSKDVDARHKAGHDEAHGSTHFVSCSLSQSQCGGLASANPPSFAQKEWCVTLR